MPEITQDDIDSATRALNLDRKGLEELTDIAYRYKGDPNFAGKVIRKAAIVQMYRLVK